MITGGLGFIGSHISEYFMQKGFEIAIIDNARNEVNVAHFRKNVEIVSASVCEYEKVKKTLKDARIVYHQAAVVSVQQSIQNPLQTKQVNVLGTKNVLKAAKENGVKRVVIASSCAVYGNAEPPLKESMPPMPLNPYAESKLENEKCALDYYSKYELETVSLRYFNVYGTRQNLDSQYAAVIPKFILALKTGQTPVIYGNGKQTRDFIYVKDVVNANVCASLAGKNACGRTFNVGTGKPTSVLSLLEQIEIIMGKKSAPDFKAERIGEIKHSYADILLAKKELNFEATWKLYNGLTETILQNFK